MANRQRFSGLVALALGVAFFVPGRANAGTVLVSDDPGYPSTTSYSLGSISPTGDPVGGQFTLTATETVVYAVLPLENRGDPVSDLTVTIHNDVSNTVGSTVLATSDPLTGGTLKGGYNHVTFTFAVPVTLSAGTYWLELSDSGSAGIDWAYNPNITNHPPLTQFGPDGSVNALTSHAASPPPTIHTNEAMFFTLLNDVPELDPASASGALALLALGATMIGRRGRKPSAA